MRKRLSQVLTLNPQLFTETITLSEGNFSLAELTKRATDVLLVVLFLISLGWLVLPIIAILIKIDSKGPVLFKQKRNGHKGQEFICLKFRTMHFEHNAKFIQATRNDSRVTRIGHFLRKTSLDELPQVFNVLKGDMSLVGPRPHPVQLDAQFQDSVYRLFDRYKSKPGMTGLAQINGLRGETASDQDMINRCRMDILYNRKKNFWLDFVIIIKSFLVFFKKDQNAF